METENIHILLKKIHIILNLTLTDTDTSISTGTFISISSKYIIYIITRRTPLKIIKNLFGYLSRVPVETKVCVSYLSVGFFIISII